MKLAIAGGTGLIGSAVAHKAESAGHEITVLHVPRPAKDRAHEPGAWNDALEKWQPETFSGYDAIMFFGGEAISSRWTDKKRQRIILSRQEPCRRMAECAARAAQRPRVIVSASATGYYGNRGEETLTESAAIGTGYLPETTAQWESVWSEAEQAGIRVVKLRLGVVLSPNGGALKMMLPAFKAGLGGRMGSGHQWMAWITINDAARVAVWAMENETISGPVNTVSPGPVRQSEFAKALGAALHRPAIAPVPAAALKLVFGQMAEETILTSCRAVPARAAEAGFHF